MKCDPTIKYLQSVIVLILSSVWQTPAMRKICADLIKSSCDLSVLHFQVVDACFKPNTILPHCCCRLPVICYSAGIRWLLIYWSKSLL